MKFVNSSAVNSSAHQRERDVLPPMLAPGVAWLALVPLYLCAFEAFVHVAGIFLHHLKRPYTPGMATAVLLELPLAIWGFHYIAAQGLVSAGFWVLGSVVMAALFLLMQMSMFRIIGTSHLQVMRAMMAKRKAAT